MRTETTLEQMREDYDWVEAFAYAGEPNKNGSPLIMPVIGDDKAPLNPFTINDITEIFASVIGQHDGNPWIAFGRLKDGRFFLLEAGCCYTGWDCDASGSVAVSYDRDLLIQFGMDDEARKILEIE